MSDGSYQRLCIAKALAECGYESDCFDNPDDQEMWDAGEEDRTYYYKRADAVLAVVGPELDRLRAEVERVKGRLEKSWQQRDAEAEDGLVAMNRFHLRAITAEAECDDLRARLADVWDEGYEAGAVDERNHADCTPNPYRAALASVPEPSDSEPAANPRDGDRETASEPAPDADREAGER